MSEMDLLKLRESNLIYFLEENGFCEDSTTLSKSSFLFRKRIHFGKLFLIIAFYIKLERYALDTYSINRRYTKSNVTFYFENKDTDPIEIIKIILKNIEFFPYLYMAYNNDYFSESKKNIFRNRNGIIDFSNDSILAYSELNNG